MRHPMKVAVLGGSNGGLATAADLTLAGHRVRLWCRADADVTALRDGITLHAEGRHGRARLDRITVDLGEALDGAELIVAALPATAHDELAKPLGAVLTETQIVLLTPGTFGAFTMARDIARTGGRLPFALAESGTLPYLARKSGPAEVKAPVRAANLPVGVFPALRTDAVLAKLADLFPVRRCVDALDAALTNAGPILHPPLVLLNLGAIDAGRFDVHAQGTTASVRRLIDVVDNERMTARRGWGYSPPHYEMATYYDEARATEGLYGAGAKPKLLASGLWSETLTLEHRYVSEDAALGLTLFESAARTAGATCPAISGLLLLFGVLLGRELSGSGRALESLGLGDFTLREIKTLLQEGWAANTWTRVVR
jgi:opine dehydrogenase